MTYDEIRQNLVLSKRSRTDVSMSVAEYGGFTVMYSDKVSGIIVDTETADILSKRHWCIDSHGYAVANICNQTIRLHDAVLALNGVIKPSGYYVDHMNHDRLDNRMNNLQVVTPTENSRNVSRKSNNKTGITGVCCDGKRFRAYITINKKRIDLGSYSTIEEAALVRKEAEGRYGYYSRPITVKDLCNQSLLQSMERSE